MMVWLHQLDWTPGAPEELEAGMVLMFNDGSWELVGDVNELRGICDDCRADWKLDDVVKWAKIEVVK